MKCFIKVIIILLSKKPIHLKINKASMNVYMNISGHMLIYSNSRQPFN